MSNVFKNAKGSPSRDEFKYRHKMELGAHYYAADVDFCLVDKGPYPDIVAVLDYKRYGDDVTFAEVIAYNGFIKRGIPVFVVTGCEKQGKFTIQQYVGGHHVKPDYRMEFVLQTQDWAEFGKWEDDLRDTKAAQYAPKIINWND